MQVQPPTFEPFDLTPARRKHIFAPDVDPSIIMQVDAIFQALTTIDWDPNNLQIGEEEELVQDKLEASNTGDRKGGVNSESDNPEGPTYRSR